MLHKNHLIVDSRNKIIVDGAEITCSLAAQKGECVFLHIPCDHGFLEKGHLCAHERSCIPIENIPCFSGCKSPYYKTMLDYLKAWSSTDVKLMQAVNLYNNFEGNKENCDFLPCLQPLLDKWMNVNQKTTIENYLDIKEEVQFWEIAKEIKTFKKKAINKAYSIYLDIIRKNDTSAYTSDYKQKEVPQESLDAAEDYLLIEKLLKTVEKETDTVTENMDFYDFYIEDNNLTHAKEHVTIIYTTLKSLSNNIDTVHGKLPDCYNLYSELRVSLDKAIKEIQEIYDKVINFQLEERHWITMDSYLICRGGGVLSFISNGEKFEDYCQTLLDRVSDVTYLIIDECQDRLLNNRRKYINYLPDMDEEEFSYKKVIEAMGTYQKMLDGNVVVKEEIKTGVILELVSNSYYEELTKKVLSLVSLAVTWAGVPEVAVIYGGIQLATAMEDSDLKSGYNAAISIDEGTQKTLPPNVYKYNNLYSTFTSVADFFSKSSETWIKEIKLNIFCENTKELSDWAPEYECDFVVIGTITLNKEGKRDLDKEFKLEIIRRGEYTMYNKWNSTKLYEIVNKEHFGEPESKTEMGNIKDIVGPEDVQ